MIVTVKPGKRYGTMVVPASKSQAHRLLIMAALSGASSEVTCNGISKDIEATMACLRELGTDFQVSESGVISVRPSKADRETLKHLYCGESGSTLRFLLPVVGALGQKAVFHREGRLSERPLSPLREELEAHGMSFRDDGELLYCEGKIVSGTYTIPGNISSQYITGLLMALPYLPGDSRLVITEKIESGGYIAMTEDALKLAGIRFEKQEQIYEIPGNQSSTFPESIETERDWSGAAFPLCMGALSEKGVTVNGLNMNSSQGDRKIVDVLKQFGANVSVDGSSVFVGAADLHGTVVDAAEIPDLVPVIASVAALSEGETRIIHAERLRIKESDRLLAVSTMLKSIGGDCEETEDGLIIRGKKSLLGGEVDSFKDHRIAMAAATAAFGCTEPVVVRDAECVNKSFPGFWEVLDLLTMI